MTQKLRYVNFAGLWWLVLLLLLCGAVSFGAQIQATGELREDDGFMKVRFSFDPTGGPVNGSISIDSTGPNYVVETIDWYGKKQDLVKTVGTARIKGDLTFQADLKGNRMTGAMAGSILYETFPEKKRKFRPPAAPGQTQPPEEFTTIGEHKTTTFSLNGHKIEGEFDFAAGKAGGVFYYPRGELSDGHRKSEDTIDKLPWNAEFPPQKVVPVFPLPLQITDTWKGVAADGVSVLEIAGALPKGFTVKSGEATLTGSYFEKKKTAFFPLQRLGTDKVLVQFEAPPVLDKAFTAGLSVSGVMVAADGSEQPFHGQTTFEVVQPPVGLVHGVWSNREAWANGVRYLNYMGFTLVSRFDYADANNGNPEVIAQRLQQWLEGPESGPFALAKGRGILCSRIDLVGHSMGGLVIRRMVADDPGQNKGLFKKVRRIVTVGTPHLGAPFADWFIYFSRSRKKSTDEDRELHPDEVLAHPYWQKGYRDWNPEAFHWLVKTVRSKKNLDNSFFQDGDAVSALSPKGTFLKKLNAANSHAKDIPYFFYYGDKSLVTAEDGDPKEWFSAAGMIDAFSWAKNEVMYDTFFSHLSGAKSDGVVPVDSAKGVGLHFSPVRTAGIRADHIELTGECSELIACALTGVYDRSAPKFVIGRLKSPAHLHAFDSQGRHVGLREDGQIELGIPGAVFVGPEEQTGVPESVFVPDESEVRFEVRGYREGVFGLHLRKESSLGTVETAYRNVPVRPGQLLKIHASEANISGLEGPAGIIEPRFSVSRPFEAGGTEGAGESLVGGLGNLFSGAGAWLSVLLGMLGGAYLMNRFIGRRRRRPMGYEGDLPPLTVSVGHLGVKKGEDPLANRQDGERPPPVEKPVLEVFSMPMTLSESAVEPLVVLEEEKTKPAVPETKGTVESVVEKDGHVRPLFKGFVYCPFCGTDLVLGATYCSRCGSRLPKWPAEEKEQAKQAKTSGAPPVHVLGSLQDGPPLARPTPEVSAGDRRPLSRDSGEIENLHKSSPNQGSSPDQPGQMSPAMQSPVAGMPVMPPLHPAVFHSWRWFFAGLWLVSISPMVKWLYFLDLFIIYRLWTSGAWFRALLIMIWAISFPIALIILAAGN